MELSTFKEGASGFLSSLSGSLGEGLPGVFVTLAILVVGVFIAKAIRHWITKTFTKATWLDSVAKGTDKANIGNSVGQLAYYVVLLNVLLIVLERMHITSVLDPLKDLAHQFTGALPRIIGAGIIFYAGWVIAKLVSSVVELAAAKVDQVLEDKGFKPDFKISKFLGAFVLGAILLPIIVAGFEFLAISAISTPAVAMITELMSAVPNIVGAGLILLVSYTVGKFAIYMLTGLLEGMNADQLPTKMGLQSILPQGKSFTQTIGSVCMFFIMLAATTAAIGKLEVPMLSNAFGSMLHFGGGIVLGGTILMIGTFLANLAYDKINTNKDNQTLAGICRFAILGLVLAMGLKSMGLADNIVNMAFAFTFGSVAIAGAIAFGFGGRDAAQMLTSKWVTKVGTKTNSTGRNTTDARVQ